MEPFLPAFFALALLGLLLNLLVVYLACTARASCRMHGGSPLPLVGQKQSPVPASEAALATTVEEQPLYLLEQIAPPPPAFTSPPAAPSTHRRLRLASPTPLIQDAPCASPVSPSARPPCRPVPTAPVAPRPAASPSPPPTPLEEDDYAPAEARLSSPVIAVVGPSACTEQLQLRERGQGLDTRKCKVKDANGPHDRSSVNANGGGGDGDDDDPHGRDAGFRPDAYDGVAPKPSSFAESGFSPSLLVARVALVDAATTTTTTPDASPRSLLQHLRMKHRSAFSNFSESEDSKQAREAEDSRHLAKLLGAIDSKYPRQTLITMRSRSDADTVFTYGTYATELEDDSRSALSC